ncbi:MAG: UvrB/UvrC motif-containing protein [Eubacteriales bacterium]
MLCQNCNQRPAQIHITKIIGGEKRELHLCDQCASLQEIFHNAFNFQSFLSNLLDMEENATQYNYSHINDFRCSGCGMSYEKFKKHGKFGCEQCYQSFRPAINPLIKKMHGKDQHKGKLIKSAGEAMRLKRNIQDLNNQLKSAIDREEYEKAAEYRDQIKAIKEEIRKSTH